jgi:hypothetical protein
LIASGERNRHRRAFTHCPGKDVPLNGVLVAGREGLDRDAATHQVTPVVDKDAARAVVGRIERDFDFDAAFGTQQLHPLVGDELCAAGKRCVARRELHHGGSQPVYLQLRVFLQQGRYPQWLFAEEESRGVDGVAPYVHQPPSAAFRNVADVLGIGVEVAEEALDRTQGTNPAGCNQFAGAQPLRMGAHHEGFANDYAGALLHRQKRLGFGNRHA